MSSWIRHMLQYLWSLIKLLGCVQLWHTLSRRADVCRLRRFTYRDQTASSFTLSRFRFLSSKKWRLRNAVLHRLLTVLITAVTQLAQMLLRVVLSEHLTAGPAGGPPTAVHRATCRRPACSFSISGLRLSACFHSVACWLLDSVTEWARSFEVRAFLKLNAHIGH